MLGYSMITQADTEGRAGGSDPTPPPPPEKLQKYSFLAILAAQDPLQNHSYYVSIQC